MARKQNPYDVLGVTKDAAAADVKKAYRRLAMKYHPDRNEGDKTAEEMFKAIGEAYEAITSSQSRPQSRPSSSRRNNGYHKQHDHGYISQTFNDLMAAYESYTNTVNTLDEAVKQAYEERKRVDPWRREMLNSDLAQKNLLTANKILAYMTSLKNQFDDALIREDLRGIQIFNRMTVQYQTLHEQTYVMAMVKLKGQLLGKTDAIANSLNVIRGTESEMRHKMD